VKAGHRYGSKGEDIQLFLCKVCWRRFSQDGSEPSECLQKNRRQSLKTIVAIPSSAEYCVSEGEMKNLVAVESQTQKTAQDRKSEQTLKGELVGFKFHQSKLNLDDKTIYNRARSIELLHRSGANLADPDSVLAVLAINKTLKSGTKGSLFQAYKAYAKWKKIDLSGIDLPKFKRQTVQPYVPKETQLDQLIAGSGWKTGAFLQLLKETGARTVEASSLEWSDIDLRVEQSQ